jgi:solute carrier family 50 (sugar transporter)
MLYFPYHKKHVIKTQSTESISFYLCSFNFIVGLEWFIYGLLINDRFVQIPNLLGALLGIVQLSLFTKYPSQSLASRSTKSKDNQLINNL